MLHCRCGSANPARPIAFRAPRGLGLGPLIRPEEERPVPDKRAADRAGPFMPVEDRLVDTGPVEEEIVGHQRVVLVVVVGAAAEAVGAALRDPRGVTAAVAARGSVHGGC